MPPGTWPVIMVFGAAHRFVAHGDGLAGLDIRQAVVVDYLQYLHLVQAGDGLGRLVVVHQDDLLAPGPEQMETGQGAHHFFVFVQNRVAAVTAGEQGLLNVVQVVAEMEGDYAARCGTGASPAPPGI